MVEVTVSGEVDPKTGMVVNLFDLKRILLNVLEEFDHKNLNLDMPYFEGLIPTSENLTRVLWTKLDTQKAIGTLHAIRLYEDEDLYAEVTAAAGLNVASVTRRYSFTAVQDGKQGPEWDCFVTVHGTIDPVTGMVTDIGALDRLVQDKVGQSFDRQDRAGLRRSVCDRRAAGRTHLEHWSLLSHREDYRTFVSFSLGTCPSNTQADASAYVPFRVASYEDFALPMRC